MFYSIQKLSFRNQHYLPTAIPTEIIVNTQRQHATEHLVTCTRKIQTSWLLSVFCCFVIKDCFVQNVLAQHQPNVFNLSRDFLIMLSLCVYYNLNANTSIHLFLTYYCADSCTYQRGEDLSVSSQLGTTNRYLFKLHKCRFETVRPDVYFILKLAQQHNFLPKPKSKICPIL